MEWNEGGWIYNRSGELAWKIITLLDNSCKIKMENILLLLMKLNIEI